jgi:hypothetical protein
MLDVFKRRQAARLRHPSNPSQSDHPECQPRRPADGVGTPVRTYVFAVSCSVLADASERPLPLLAVGFSTACKTTVACEAPHDTYPLGSRKWFCCLKLPFAANPRGYRRTQSVRGNSRAPRLASRRPVSGTNRVCPSRDGMGWCRRRTWPR